MRWNRLQKKLSLFLGAAMVAGMLAGCGSTNKEIELKETDKKIILDLGWWGNDPRHVYTIEAIKKFEELHPNIKVKYDYGTFGNYQTRWNIKMKAGIEPDVMQINYAWMKNYTKGGVEAFYDINQASEDIDLSTYSDTSISYGTVDGKLYALPIALNIKNFVYDAAVYEAHGLSIPQTWDDLFEAAKVLNKDGIYPLDMESSSAWFVCESYVEQKTGKEFADADGNLNLTKDDFKMILECYLDMVKGGVVEDFTSRNSAGYGEGRYAGAVVWVTDIMKYQGTLPEGHTYTLGEYPVLAGASRTGRYSKPATMYAVGKNTENPKEAAMLLDFLVNSEDMIMLQELEKGVPESTKQRDKLVSEGLLTGIMNDTVTQMANDEYYLVDPTYEDGKYHEGLKNAVDSVLYNNDSIDAAAAAYYEAVTQ